MLFEYYEIVVFTAGLRDYANFVLDDFDKDNLISRRLYRDSCSFRRGIYMKDLTKVRKDLQKVIIIDNIAENFALQPNNGI